MKKLLGFLSFLIALLITLIIAAGIYLYSFFDPNDFKGLVSKEVKKATGRELTIQGDISLSWFPWLALEVGPVELSNVPGFAEQPFAQVAGAQIRVKLLPLLRKSLEMDTVTLQGLKVYLVRNKQGKTNWDDLTGKPTSPQVAAEPTAKNENDPPVLVALSVGGIKLTDAKVTWDDQSTGQYYVLENLDLKTGTLTPDEPFALEWVSDVSSREPAARAHLAFAGKVIPGADYQSVQVAGSRLKGQLSSRAFDVERADIEIAADIALDMSQQLLQMNGMRLHALSTQAFNVERADIEMAADIVLDMSRQLLQVSGMRLRVDGKSIEPTGNMRVNLSADGVFNMASQSLRLTGANLTTEGDLVEPPIKIQTKLSTEMSVEKMQVVKLTGLVAQIDASGLQPTMQTHVELASDLTLDTGTQQLHMPGTKLAGRFKTAGLPEPGIDAALVADIAVDLAHEAVSLEKLSLQAAGLSLSGEVSASEVLKTPAYRGRVNLKTFNPREVLQRLGQAVPKTADGKVLTQADGQLVFQGSDRALNVKQMQLKLDDTVLHGDVKVTDFAQPAVKFTLALNHIDLDRYLPPDETPTRPAPSRPESKAPQITDSLPLETLRTLNLDGNLRVDRLKVNNLLTSNVQVKVKAKEGRIQVQPLRADLYGGRLDGNLGLEARGKTLRTTVNQTLVGVQVGPLLKDLVGKDRLLGRTYLRADLATEGSTPEEMRRLLKGQIRFSLTDGAVKGINIAKLLRETKARLKGKPIPPSNEPDQTDFTELSGTMQLHNGVAYNNDLMAKSPLLRVDGEGKIDLVQEQLDYQLTVNVVGSLRGQGGKELEELKHLAIPLRIQGALEDPKFQLDLERLLKERAKKKLHEKIQEELEERLGSEQPTRDTGERSKESLQDLLKDELRKGLGDLFGR